MRQFFNDSYWEVAGFAILKLFYYLPNFIFSAMLEVICKIPLLARRTRPVGQARRATIGYLVYNVGGKLSWVWRGHVIFKGISYIL